MDKPEIKPIPFIGDDSESLKLLNQIAGIRERLSKHIFQHNELVELREAVAEVASEYLKISLKEMGATWPQAAENTRRLLIKGCEKVIEELAEQIALIKEELKAITDKFKNENT